MGIGFGFNGLATTLPLYALFVALWTIGEFTAAPVANAAVADLSPLQLRGIYQGIYGTSWSLASFAGPVLGGVILEHWGGQILWLSCLVLGLLVSSGYWLVASKY